jgi:hypothetical protein
MCERVCVSDCVCAAHGASELEKGTLMMMNI